MEVEEATSKRNYRSAPSRVSRKKSQRFIEEEIEITTDKNEGIENIHDVDSEGSSDWDSLDDDEPEEYADEDNISDTEDEDLRSSLDEMDEWTWSLVGETFNPPQIPQFRKTAFHCTLKANHRPIDFFLLIFDQNLINSLIKWTNDSARRISNVQRRAEHKALWYAIGDTEMKCFIGILIAMSLLRRSSIKEYWTDSRILCSPGIQELFSYSRFRELYNSLMLRPHDINVGQEDMLKINRLSNRIIANSRSMYEPEKELSLDECMIPFTGRHRWKVFLKAKPIKYGFKAYILAEAKTGYILNWHLHTGDPGDIDSEEAATFSIVKKLAEPYDYKGHHIFMDRYYSGLRIFRYLTLKGFGASGTIMANRLKLTDDIKEELATFAYQEYDFYEFGENMMLTAWKDKNMVMLLSTIHSTDTVNYSRMVKARDDDNIPLIVSEQIDKPVALAEYAKHMGGVDRFNQMLYNYHFYHRNCRWYVRIFTHFLEIAILRSYIIYKTQCEKQNKNPISRYEFHEELANNLVENYRKQKHIPTSPKKDSGETKQSTRNFFPTEEVFARTNSNECRLEDLPDGSKPNCTVCELENKIAQCTKVCRTHDKVIHVKCFEKHKILVSKNIKH